MSLARVPSPTSFRTSINTSQLRGLPFPRTHSFRISKLICSASSRHFATTASISSPVSSFRSWTPNWEYFVPIRWGILILAPPLPGKHNNFGSFGVSTATRDEMNLCEGILNYSQENHTVVKFMIKIIANILMNCFQKIDLELPLRSSHYWAMNWRQFPEIQTHILLEDSLCLRLQLPLFLGIGTIESKLISNDME